MNRYIDVRGPIPVYINGMVTITLDGAKRDITVEEAERLIKINRLVKEPTYHV